MEAQVKPKWRANVSITQPEKRVTSYHVTGNNEEQVQKWIEKDLDKMYNGNWKADISIVLIPFTL